MKMASVSSVFSINSLPLSRPSKNAEVDKPSASIDLLVIIETAAKPLSAGNPVSGSRI